MAIKEKEILVSLHPSNMDYYRNKGYDIPKYFDKKGRSKVKRGTKILVKTTDIIAGSSLTLTKICDECGKETPNIHYEKILLRRKNSDGKDRCIECGQKYGSNNKKNNVKYEKSLESFALENNKQYLINEFSDKNLKEPSQVSFGSTTEYWWICPVYGKEHEYQMKVCERTNKNGCPYCAGRRVNHTNCLATTHPDIAKLLKNNIRAFELTHGSRKKEVFICSRCKNEEEKTISTVSYYGFSCPKCSDGLSYPEKFMMNILNQLNIEFKRQHIFKWSKNVEHENKKLKGSKIYDFYIPAINCIIEIHGLQHYKESFSRLKNGAKTLVEEQENDLLKERIAKTNGIKNYIVVDCALSDLNYIKQNIVDSELKNFFNLSSINWEKCHKYSCETIVKKACDMWNSGNRNTKEVGEILNLCVGTVIKYLKQGNVIGWCQYDPKEVMRENAMKNGRNNSKKTIQLSLDGKIIKEWGSAAEAKDNLFINNISSVCTGKQKTAGGFKWMYKEDYEKYINQVS
jgi:hypothetical protein